MKKTFKQTMSWILVMAMLFSFVPVIPITAAEENTPAVTRDAFGIIIEGDLSAEEVEYYKKNNPYGTEEWFPLFTANELYYVEGHENGRYFRSYDYDGTMGKVRDGERIGGKNEGNGSGFTMMDPSPIDLYGTGSKEYVATVAYWYGGSKLELFVTDKNGDRVTDTYNLAEGDSIDNLDAVSAYATTGFVSVAAGDFDGDGVDTIIAYIPRMEYASPAIAEYKVENGKIVWVRDVLGTHVFDILGNDDLTSTRSKNTRVLRNTPAVQVLAEDVDNDNIDEVIITAGMHDTYDNIGKGVDGNGKVGSQLFIYDFIPEFPNGDGTEARFNQTFKAALHKSGAGQSASSSGRLRFASSSVGNVTATSGGADYPEIISAGWVDSDGGNGIGLDGETINFNQVTCTKAYAFGGTAIGNYSHSSLGTVNTKEFVYGGFYDDSVESLVPVQVFSPWGPAHADAIFAGGVVYKIENNQIQELYHRGYFDDDDDGIGGHIITNGLIIDVTAGNFANDPDGREQLVFATMQKQKAVNDYFSCMYTYTCDSGEFSEPTEGWDSYDDGWLTYDDADAFITLCAPDLISGDSTVVRIKNVSRTYTEPEVLAILEATPYFEEIPDSINNSETSYGKSDTAGVGSSTSNTLQTNVVAGFEWSMDDLCAGFVCGAGFEATIENNFTWSTSEEQYETFEVNYANDSGENAVIVYRRPVIVYEYEVRGTDNTMVLAKEGELSTSMISVEEYNEAAAQYGLDIIPEGMLGEPGNPFSYRSTKDGLANVATKDNLTTQYNGTGTITQSFTNGTSTSSEYEYELNTSFTAYGMVFGAKVGGGAGYAHTTSESTVNTTEISKAGTVSGIQADGYDFQWQFAHWNTTINGTEIPVLGYIIRDIVAPPSPPKDLGVDEVTTTSAKISWNHGSRPAEEYRIYQYFAQNDKYIQIATVDGTETTCEITNLLPDNTYTVVVRSYTAPTGLVGIGGESVNSEALSFATAPEGAAPILIDGAYDVHTKVGSSATFNVDVTLPGDKYTTVDYQWQMREIGSSWVNIDKAAGKSLTVENVTAEMDGTLYRCEINALYAGSLITYYGDVAKLHVGKASSNVELSVTGYSDGYGTLAEPYTGKADYLVQSGTTDTHITTNKNLTVNYNGTDLIVYGTPVTAGEGTTVGAPYFGYDSTSGAYYALTENGGDFTVVGEIKEAFEKVYTGISEAPAGFDSELRITTDASGSTYYLVAAVTGTTKTPITAPEPEEGEEAVTTVDTRLEGLTDITYYWILDGEVYAYGEGGTIGEKVTDVSVSELYEVYVKGETEVVLGKGETYTVVDEEDYTDVEEMWYYDVVYTPATEGAEGVDPTPAFYTVTPFTESEVHKYVLNEEDYSFDSSLLSIITVESVETVSVPVYTSEQGSSLSLTSNATDNTGVALSGANVTFRMINTVSGAVEEIKAVTDTSGKATAKWRAPSSNLYRLEIVVGGNTKYLGSVSEAKYYDALGTPTADNTTEYRLLLTDNGETLAGTMPFGNTFGFALQSRVAGTNEWADYAAQIGERFTYTITAPQKAENKVEILTYTPSMAGAYTVRVYRGDNIDANALVAAATLDVTRLAVTITPTWESTPMSADDVTLVSTYGGHTDGYLKTVFNVSCPYFVSHSSSGIFTVSLGYKAGAAADEFKSNFQVTLESAGFTIKPSSAPVYFASGENGTVVGRSGDNLFLMASGSSQTSGTKLTFNAEPDAGYAVDKWIINGTEYSVDSAAHPDWFRYDGDALVIDSFDASNGSSQISDGALEIEVAFASASNVVTYSVNGNVGGSVSAVVDDGNDTSLVSGTSVAKGVDLVFTATALDGYVIDRWVVNGEIYTWESGDKYAGEVLSIENIDENHTVVVYFIESTEKYSVTTSVYSESGVPAAELATISATNAEGGEDVLLTDIAKNTSITFTANLNETNNTVKEWQTSTDGVTYTTVRGSGGKGSYTLYNISENTYVRAIITNAQSYTLSYAVLLGGEEVTDESIAKLTANGNGTALASGGTYGAYIPVDFELTLNSDYYVVEWSDTVTVDDTLKNANLAALNANLEVDVVIAEKPVVTVATADNGNIVALGTNADTTEIDVSIAEGAAEHIDLDSNLTVTATPDENYYVSAVYVDGEAVYTDNETDYTGGEMTFEVENITEDAEIEVVYAEKPVVTFAGDSNITVTATQDEITLASGDHIEKYSGDIAFTATPKVGYETDKWTLGGAGAAHENENVEENDVTVYTVSGKITSNVAIGVSSKAIPQYEIAVSVEEIDAGGAHGTVSASVTRKALDGYTADLANGGSFYRDSDITITATPDAGYRVKTYTWNIGGNEGKGITVPAELLANVQGDVTVTARFVKIGSGITFDPTDAESTGGYISAATTANVDVYENANGLVLEEGVELHLSATEATGYEVAGWYENGILAEGTEGMTEYTYVSNGNDETAITVQFREILYTVEAEIENGSISVATLTDEGMARGGTSLTFTASPEIGYGVCDWLVNGESMGIGGSTFTWVVENGAALDTPVDTFTVEAVLERNSFTVTYTNTLGGTLSSETASGSYVADGDEVTITATAHDGYKFGAWKVNGKKHGETTENLTLIVTADTTVEAIFEPDGYTVTFETVGERGTIRVTANGDKVRSGDIVDHDAELVITVTPRGTNMVNKWLINGETPDGYEMTDTADAALTYTTTVAGDITVSVEIIACPTYTVTVISGANGSVSEEEITVSRNGSVTVTALPNAYYQFDAWTVDGVLDTESGAELTITDIKKDIEVSAAFKEAIRYDVTFTVVCETGNASTASVSAGGIEIYPTSTEPVRVVGNSTVVFTASPAMNGENNADMVASWTVNGNTVDNLSNVLTIEKLTEKTDVVLTFTEYKGYTIPTSDGGYTITDIVRTPDDTAPATEIREGGDITFTVTPEEEHHFTKLIVNEFDIFGDDESDDITVVDNGDGSYTVTVSDVSELTFTAEALMYQVVLGELLEVPESLTGKYAELEALEKALRTEVTKVNKNYKNTTVFDIVLKYTTDGGTTWLEATAEHYPAGGVKVYIPYADIADKVDKTYNFTVVHMFTSDMDGHNVGDTETITPVKTENGIEFTVNSFSPFAIGYFKKVATPPSGGGFSGGAPSSSDTYTVTIIASVGGKVTPEGQKKYEDGEKITVKAIADKGYVLKELLVDGVSVGAKAEYTLEITRAYRIEAIFEKVGCTEETCPMAAFSDLVYTAWYHDGVHFALESELMVGMSRTKFEPDGKVTRAQLVTILWRMENEPVVNYLMTFKDVPQDVWYAEAVRWATAEKIVNGYNDLEYGSNDAITREQMATMLYRYMQYKGYDVSTAADISSYADFDSISEYAVSAIQYAVGSGLIKGRSANTLNPADTATRAEIATIMQRFCEKTK